MHVAIRNAPIFLTTMMTLQNSKNHSPPLLYWQKVLRELYAQEEVSAEPHFQYPLAPHSSNHLTMAPDLLHLFSPA
jgi:hypothetical protein